MSLLLAMSGSSSSSAGHLLTMQIPLSEDVGCEGNSPPPPFLDFPTSCIFLARFAVST